MTKIEKVDAQIAFQRFGLNLDPHLLNHDHQDIIDFALKQLSRSEIRLVRVFLLTILSLPASELRNAWAMGNTNVIISRDRELRNFINEILYKIDAAVGPG